MASPSQPAVDTSQADSTIKEEDLDASIEADISQEPLTTQPDSMQVDSSVEQSTLQVSNQDMAVSIEPRIPTKKDASLREFLNTMDDYAPIIPDAVTNYYLTLSGLPPPPQTPHQLARLLSLATQKFISDIAADAYQYARIRSSNTASNNPMGAMGATGAVPAVGGQAGGAAAGAGIGKEAEKNKNLGVQRPGYGGGGQGGSGQGRTVLTMEDLGMAVGEYGVNVKRSEFYR